MRENYYTLYLPIPPTQNNSLVPVRAGKSTRLVDSPAVREWRGESEVWFDRQFDIMRVIKKDYILDTVEEPHIFVYLHFCVGDNSGDIDGRVKKSLDFCTGRFFTDDRKVEGILCTRTRVEDMRWQEGMSPVIRMCQTDGVVPHVRLRLFNLADLHPVIDMGNWKDCVV